MSLFKQSIRKRAEIQRQRRRGTKRPSPVREKFHAGSLLAFSLHVLFWMLAVVICFFGLSTAGPMVQQDQVSRVRISAQLPFTYTSDIRTDRRMEAVRQKVPPVFRLDLAPFRGFRDYSRQLFEELRAFADLPENAPEDLSRLRPEEVATFLRDYPPGNPYALRPDDLATLYNQLGPERAAEVLSEGLIILGEIYRRGIYGEDNLLRLENTDQLTLFNVEDERGQLRQVDILSLPESLRTLRIQIAAFDIPRQSTVALFRVLRSGLDPNLTFDEGKTRKRVQAAQAKVEPVRIEVPEGENIIEPNSPVSALQYEQLEAYREVLREAGSADFGFNSLFIERALLSVLLVAGAAFFLRISRNRIQHNPRLLALSGAIILLNLLLIRLVIELGDSLLAETSPLLVQLIPYLTPLILGPVLITILVGVGPGLLAAGFISVFNAMMQNNALSTLLVSQLACLTAIYYCRNIQLRASLVRAGLLSGGTMAIAAVLLAFRSNLEMVTILARVLASLGNGLLAGMLVVGLLPILEQLFKYTTDITLLELTDFNHPLLRKMQVKAPGSYHHSLMVANLSENAAAAVGAKPLVCRVCALFHDIGKMVKPEYFAENQREGRNPHIERNPSMSALVIKSHVKEGVQMAREYRLPHVIVDVIRQHHGTSLIQYFYYKAIEQQQSEGVVESIYPNAPRIELSRVNEDTYRYEGPIPQFAESAIIMLADSIEAASRSLRKVTPQSVDELVGKIFFARMEDGQLDAAPLTVAQLVQIRESFTFTLLNMLHARVEYPEGKPGQENGRGTKQGQQKSAAPAETGEGEPSSGTS